MPETLAEWFTRHLDGCNLTLMAERLGTSRQTLYAYQKGTIKPTLPKLYAFCKLRMVSEREKRAAVDLLAAS